MIRAADIIARRKQKTSTMSTPPLPNVDVFHKNLKSLDKKNATEDKKIDSSCKSGEKNTKESKELQKASTTSLARTSLRDYKRVSISSKNKEFPITFTRTSDTVDTFKFHVETADCDYCPAAGYWDYMGSGKWCFHRAYYLGKSGKPVLCDTAMHDCPLTK